MGTGFFKSHPFHHLVRTMSGTVLNFTGVGERIQDDRSSIESQQAWNEAEKGRCSLL